MTAAQGRAVRRQTALSERLSRNAERTKRCRDYDDYPLPMEEPWDSLTD